MNAEDERKLMKLTSDKTPKKYRAFLSNVLKLTATTAGLLAVADAFQQSPRLRIFFREAVRYGIYYAKRTIFEMAWRLIFRFPKLIRESKTSKNLPPGFTTKTWTLLTRDDHATPTSEILVYWLSNPSLWHTRPLTPVYAGKNHALRAVRMLEYEIQLDGVVHPLVIESLETFAGIVYA